MFKNINSANGSSLKLLLCQSCSITCVWFPVEVLTGLGLACGYLTLGGRLPGLAWPGLVCSVLWAGLVLACGSLA